MAMETLGYRGCQECEIPSEEMEQCRLEQAQGNSKCASGSRTVRGSPFEFTPCYHPLKRQNIELQDSVFDLLDLGLF